ncbi:MAG: SDR family oxidoreductase [Kangiellaceae bacterium]
MTIDPNNYPVALITGASKRIGKSIALELHERGINISLHCNHSKLDADQLAADLNVKRKCSAYVIQKDLSENIAPKYIIDKTLTHFNRIDYLVNNASIFYPMPIQQTDESQFHKILKVNATQAKKLILLVREEIKKRKGAIVNLADIYAQRGHIDHSVYVASKSILLELTKQLALEFSPNIRINSVSPGAILWPENESEEQKNQRLKILENTAIKRVGNATDISKAVSFLLLDATYITGANINVDGGRSLYI